MVAFPAGDQDGGAFFDKVPGAGGVQAGAVDFDLAGGTQRGDRDAFHADPVIRLGLIGGGLGVFQHQVAFAEPAAHGAAVGKEHGQADQQQDAREGKQRRNGAVQQPAAAQGDDLQYDAANAGNAETGDESLNDDETGADHKADDHNEIQRERIHTVSSFQNNSQFIIHHSE